MFAGWKFPTLRTDHPQYERVIFHKGYTNETMEFEIVSIDIIENQPNDLNVPKCWEIKLGDRIK